MKTLALLLFCFSLSGAEWKSLVRRDHPRLFFNRETWPAVRAHALGAETETLTAMRKRVDELAATTPTTRDYGAQAAEAAFVFLATGEDRYRVLAERLVERSLAYYRECHAAGREVNWYSFSRINVLAAYDWLYNSMDAAKRRELGAGLLDSIQQEQPTKARRSYARENWGGIESGFYSTPSLLWYAGLATYGDGINDELADRFLSEGYRLFIALLEHRRKTAGDDGGSASGALNYCLAAYPWAEFNFFHTFKSATGADIARDWPYVAYLPGYIFWNWLPQAREFGYGDAYHTTNRMPLGEMNIHLTQIIQFYAESKPECAGFAKWLAARTTRESRSAFPFTRFLLTATPDVTPARDPERRMPLARQFEGMGQTFFRSGSGPEDTYALFTAGGALEQHKHFDHNNFVIYRKGFLAIDTGTRPEPGQHLTHYYSRTVAHNAVLIHMPGEQMPRYWGNRAPEEEDLPVPNDGGQRKALGSKVVAFETNRDYAYIAGDATPAYHDQKCRLALRQFVFLPPNHFVVFDRVVATRPEYKKTWLLHTVAEPDVGRNQFSAVHEQGKLFCRTLLPEKAAPTKIGGPGKQFWSGGRNWPLPRGYRTPDTTPLLGQWRVEVSPAGARADDVFLHVIEAGDAAQPAMGRVQLVRKDDRAGVRVEASGDTWEVWFGTAGPPSGHISRRRAGKVELDRDLTREVMPQAGLWGGER
jgi:heparin/heparan-sulfate lyase